MRTTIIAAVLAAGLIGSAAQADSDTSFRGFRAEIQGGGDRLQSEGVHDDTVAVGGAIGFDGTIGQKIVIGPEFSYWRGRGQNVTDGVSGGEITHKSLNELGAGVRVGYLVQPKLLVYGIGGYVNDEQRKTFTGTATEAGFYNHFHTDGYQLGGGVEYSLMDHVYTGLGYRYSNYDDHTARQRLFVSAGIRF
jgi:outer membrane immunogenic protein